VTEWLVTEGLVNTNPSVTANYHTDTDIDTFLQCIQLAKGNVYLVMHK